MALNRRFSPITLLMLSINGMIGSAWLFAPLYAAKIAGAGALIAWVIGGIATAIIALTFAELSTLMPVAGGTACIPQMSHGALTSFMLSWVAWLSALTMAPIEVQAVLQYASTYFPSLSVLQLGTHVLTKLGLVWATFLMLGLCIVNVFSFKGLVRFNFILFIFKLLVILLTIFWIIRQKFYAENFHALSFSMTNTINWHAILAAVASGGVAFAFTGFKHGVELAGEAKQSDIAIPLAIVGSVIVCLMLYMGLEVAFIGAIKPALLENGWGKLSFIGDVGPFAGLAAGLGLIWLLKFLYLDAIVSPLGAGLIYVTSTARLLFAMSSIGYVPRFLSRLDKNNFPILAICMNFFVGMLLFLPFPGWQSMVSFLVSAMVMSYAIGPIALLCLRLEFPTQARSFQIPYSKFICLCAFYFCNLLTYWTGWLTVSKLTCAIVMGFCLFAIAVVRGKVAPNALGLLSLKWILPYLLGLNLISYLGAFEGLQIIPFGWDFLVIAIFSCIILYLAVSSRKKHAAIPFAEMLASYNPK